jgi:hypothetical protein
MCTSRDFAFIPGLQEIPVRWVMEGGVTYGIQQSSSK